MGVGGVNKVKGRVKKWRNGSKFCTASLMTPIFDVTLSGFFNTRQTLKKKKGKQRKQ